MEDILKRLVLELHASSGAIMVAHEEEKVLKCAASFNMPEVWVALVNPLENTPDKNRNGRVAITGTAEIANHIDVEFHGHLISSIIVVPIKRSEKVIGNIEIITDDPSVTFTTNDKAILERAAQEELVSVIQ